MLWLCGRIYNFFAGVLELMFILTFSVIFLTAMGLLTIFNGGLEK
ncbi:MAG: hypothetical protein WC499_01955 [Patescibacteria group bacterium]